MFDPVREETARIVYNYYSFEARVPVVTAYTTAGRSKYTCDGEHWFLNIYNAAYVVDKDYMEKMLNKLT